MAGHGPRRLVLIGDSAFAEIAFEYFTQEGRHEVVAFAVEQTYLKRTELLGLPVIAVEDMVDRYPPAEHAVYAAVVYTKLNRLRARLAAEARARGYYLASYISPHAFIAASAKIGEHCFIFENNVIQSHVEIGNNVVLWSGNHIGHHSRVGDNVFASSHVVISGFCSIGENTFLGVNSTIANDVTVAPDCWVGPGIVISSGTQRGALFRSAKPEIAKVDAYRFFGVDRPP